MGDSRTKKCPRCYSVGCQGLLLNAATLRWLRERALAKQREYDRHTPHIPSKKNKLTGVSLLETLATFTVDVLSSLLIP